MKIVRHSEIEKDFKKLKKHFKTPIESLEAWERLFEIKGLEETPAIDRYSGFGNHEIYKARVVPLRENCGKSKGYRVIFELVKESEEICIITCFSRHGIYKKEQELMNLIKERIE